MNDTSFARGRAPQLALVAAVLLAACGSDGGVGPSTPEAELFARYVALGNSITAGVQSAGINDSTQRLAYPVLLAGQAGFGNGFGVPLLNRPGCPAPLAAPLATQRVGSPTQPCYLRVLPAPRLLQNLAVPGARMGSAVDGSIAANPLTTLLLGGRTQAELMVAARPTLVSVWLGNNDALDAALSADPARLTPLADFEASLDALVSRLVLAAPVDAVLIGVVDPVTVPALQPGAFLWLAKQAPPLAPRLPNPVSGDCAPTSPAGEPNPSAANLVSLQIVGETLPGTGRLREISCAGSAPYVLSPEARSAITQRVAAFNASIEARAQANGWLYLDPNEILEPFLADPAALRRCQRLAQAIQAGDAELIAQAIADSCPNPEPTAGFGSLVSYDGVHPSSRAHRILTNVLVERLNARHGLALPALPID